MESAIEFCAVDMPQANRLTVHIMAAIAEHEREMISLRTKAALAAAKERGQKLGNPRWQESIHKATAARKPAPTSEQLTQMILDLRAQGKTLRAIADQMNGLGLKTPTGARWYLSSVQTVLKRAANVVPITSAPSEAA